MDLTSFYYFTELAKDLNMSRTAQRIFVSQQTISNHIQRLEEFYGMPLFYRKPRLSLTYAGETVLRFADDLIRDCDIAVGALDNIPSRRILSVACEKAGIPYVYGAIQGWNAQAAVSMPGDGLIQKLFPEEIEIRDKSVLSFTPALCASIQASLCVKLLTGRPVETGCVYYFDLLNQEFETIPMT